MLALAISAEVGAALQAHEPVVALESSVIAQGLPAPFNVDAWRRCEAAVRRAGATPATVAVLDGSVRLGLEESQVQRLAAMGPGALKVASSDLAWCVALGQSGGTTVSATCEVAASAGIRVMATGGIGGVHRHAEQTGDVSQDLWALSRFAVAVVCAGAKAVLDLPRTLEALETLAVPVVGVRTGEFPAFYYADSGLPLALRVEGTQEAARVAELRFAQGPGAVVFALPPPRGLPRALVERAVGEALAQAAREGIQGKRVTPFLLDGVRRATQGESVRVNVELLEANAAFAGEVARRLAKS